MKGRPRMAIAGLDISELFELALLLVAVGALSGFLAGLFGIGGGAILVPVFYECFRLVGVPLEVRMPLCIGTSLAIIIPTSISSFRAHYVRGAVDLNILKYWWLPVALGYVYAGWPAAARFPDVAALQLPFSLGYVSLIGALLVMPTSLLTAPLGVRAAHALSKRKLEIAFGC